MIIQLIFIYYLWVRLHRTPHLLLLDACDSDFAECRILFFVRYCIWVRLCFFCFSVNWMYFYWIRLWRVMDLFLLNIAYFTLWFIVYWVLSYQVWSCKKFHHGLYIPLSHMTNHLWFLFLFCCNKDVILFYLVILCIVPLSHYVYRCRKVLSWTVTISLPVTQITF